MFEGQTDAHVDYKIFFDKFRKTAYCFWKKTVKRIFLNPKQYHVKTIIKLTISFGGKTFEILLHKIILRRRSTSLSTTGQTCIQTLVSNVTILYKRKMLNQYSLI